MLYRNYLTKLAIAFEHRFEQISVHFNFDNGDEFEIALCHMLREILPQKYGICRGFVVALDGSSAGDDIIIYDKVRFPALRLFAPETYEIKQDIPVEAMYAYIEAKHTLIINGDNLDGQSLQKALSQVAKVKRINREDRNPNFTHPFFTSSNTFTNRQDWPPTLNPIYGAIIARQVKLDKKGPILSPARTKKELIGACLGDKQTPPDLIIAGNSNLIVPTVSTPEGQMIHSPFYIQNVTSSLEVMPVKKLAFSMGIVFLLYALDTIELGRMPWEQIIYDGIKSSSF